MRALYTRLTKDGVDAWLDKEKLLPGQDWELEIRKAVREADVVVVCLSKQFNQAGFRQKEVRLALDTAMEQPEGEIFIIPARLEECDTLESLRKWHWVDLFEDNGYEMFIRALQIRANNIDALLTEKNNWISKTITSNIEKAKLEKLQLNKAKLVRKHHKSIIISLISLVGLLVVVFLFSSLAKSWFSPTSVNAPMPIATCISPAANPYLSYSELDVVKIYEDYRLGNISLETAKQNALSNLGKSTENWSDFVDVALDETKIIRIM